MQGKHLYEYAVLRAVPRVEREEFLTIGVVLYCAELNFLETRYRIDTSRLSALHQHLDLEALEKHCASFSALCRPAKKGDSLETMAAAARFRWLTAKRSTVLQVSPVHPGLCNNPSETLGILMKQLVL